MLPLGSIVKVKDETGKTVDMKIIIVNRFVTKEEGVYYDYSGSIYPLGDVKGEVFTFNEEVISKIIFEGYTDDDEYEYLDAMLTHLKKNNFEKGE